MPASLLALLPDLPWQVYAFLFAPLAVLLFGAIYKTLQVRAASDWPSTPGKVTVSGSEVREVKILDEHRETGFRMEPRNFANIVYQYTVSGQLLTNNRVSIDEDRGNFGIAETIARYPVGTAVTVYYNSRHPREAVLERDTPKGWWGCFGIGMAITLAVMFGSLIGLNQLGSSVAARLPHPKYTALVIMLGIFAVVLALFALAMRKQMRLARHWPVVPGTIHMSDIQQYRAAAKPGQIARGPIMYQRQLSFAYRYNNIAYSNVAASLATGIYSRSGWLVGKFKAAYQDGAGVDVYVNPANPSEATLDPRDGVWLIWLLSLLAAGFAAATYYAAHIG